MHPGLIESELIIRLLLLHCHLRLVYECRENEEEEYIVVRLLRIKNKWLKEDTINLPSTCQDHIWRYLLHVRNDWSGMKK